MPKPAPKEPDRFHNITSPLTSYVERIERLREQQKELGEDIREIKTEAKAAGFDPRMLTEMIRLRAMDAETRKQREDLRDTYINALDLV